MTVSKAHFIDRDWQSMNGWSSYYLPLHSCFLGRHWVLPSTCEQTKNIHPTPQNTQHTRLHLHVSTKEFLRVCGLTILHVPDWVRHCSFWWLSAVLMCHTICAGENTVCSA